MGNIGLANVSLPLRLAVILGHGANQPEAMRYAFSTLNQSGRRKRNSV